MPGPGVTITTATRSGPVAPAAAPGARYFVAGQTNQGPLTPTIVRSLGDYVATFGPRVAFGSLYDDLRVYFEEGGLEAVVCRTVGPAAAVATVSLSDKAATPVPTLKVDAANPGAWGAGISVGVVASATAGAFDLTITYNSVLVESYTALVTPADAVAALAVSAYVRGTSLGSATAPPANQPAVGTFALTGGSDDRASVLATHYAAALDKATDAYGTGVVSCPGQPLATMGAALQAHAIKYARIALLAMAPGSTLTQTETAVTTFRAANPTGLEYAGVFWPSINFTDGKVARTVTPEGFVAAGRTRALSQRGGPWSNPAGAGSVAQFVTSTDIAVDAVAGAEANANGISALRTIGATGPRLYGWRSLSLDTTNYFELKDRDVLNAITSDAKALMEPYAFSTIDAGGQLLGRMRADLLGLCQRYASFGALYPLVAADGVTVVDSGYDVDVSAALNTQAVVLSGQVAAAVAVRLAPTAETVTLTLLKAAIGSSVQV